MRQPGWAVAASTALALLANGGSAGAQVADISDLKANRLFHEAEELFDAHRFGEACEKFAESERLDAQLGTLLNLAFCHESEGRTARALGEFDLALRWALQKGQREREAFARDHIAALERRLSFVILERPDVVQEGLIVHVDDVLIDRGRWGEPLAMDPGMHTLVATATAKESQPIVFFIERGPSTRILRIPTLVDDPEAAERLRRAALPRPPPAPPVDDGARWRRERTAAWITLGAGAAALAVGAGLGAVALSKATSMVGPCQPGPCPPSAVAAGHDSKAFAAAAGITAGVGLAAVATGVFFLVRSTRPPHLPSATMALGAFVDGTGATAAVGGTF